MEVIMKIVKVFLYGLITFGICMLQTIGLTIAAMMDAVNGVEMEDENSMCNKFMDILHKTFCGDD